MKSLTLDPGKDLFSELDELESRLEQQIGVFFMSPAADDCLWYLCNPKCEGSKCLTVCPVEQ